MPRITIRTPELVEGILSRLSMGEPLAVICRDEGMPHVTTWAGWVRDDEAADLPADQSLSIAYARAREVGFDAIAAECLEIIDDEPERVVVTSGDDRTETRIDSASVQWAKNRAETRLKLLAKWDPKRYGDRVDLTSSDRSMSPAGLSALYGDDDDSEKNPSE